MTFTQKLEEAIAKNNSLLCVGLDPDPFQGVSFKGLYGFNKQIIDQTADIVCCYKPQIAFYAAAGTEGLEDLKRTIGYIHKNYPLIPVLLDAKRGDIGHTSEMYVKEVFDVFKADAVTVNPYYGFDAVEPFAKRNDRGIFVICRTSNPSATDFQNLKIGRDPLYVKVAKEIIRWSKRYPNVYLEIGATWPGEIGVLRKLAPNMIFLVAGIGAQGGDLEGTLKKGLINPSSSSFPRPLRPPAPTRNRGERSEARKRESKSGLIISASRSIIYTQDPRIVAQKLRDEINQYRET